MVRGTNLLHLGVYRILNTLGRKRNIERWIYVYVASSISFVFVHFSAVVLLSHVPFDTWLAVSTHGQIVRTR